MEKRTLLYLFLLCFVYTLDAKSYIEDYCWRDYDGTIPTDAMAHGLDSQGKPVYVGQALYQDKLIPGQIYTNDRNVYFEWNGEEISTYKNVKILCSKHADKFEWVQTTKNKIVLLVNKILIKGGYESQYTTYIGRKEVNGVTYLGKIVCSTDDCFEYCWRDYVGIIPEDAFAGGMDKRGKPTYIGQALHEDKLIPGQIFVNDDKVHFEWAFEAYAKSENVKILCTERPGAFEWIDTTNEDVNDLALNETLFYGGFEPNHFTYIGRALADGVTNVGKITCTLDSCLGILITHNDEINLHQVFQILAYNSTMSIDFRSSE
ncbi:hypothetical protein ILUMI_10517 [Ignelater luminosus]|uniref:Uncharacterized protein n=1 Tax=Ignelater luminosus TaxID=2038154 RepID=A0A8K0CXQ5_IGNLU|nr:hypothetical protein ILUMI_10517 [Ignelater luminosus]